MPDAVPAKDLNEATLKRWNDLSKMVANEHGREVLKWIIYELGGLEEPSYHDNPLMMARTEGRRGLARELNNELRRIDVQYGTDLSRRVFEARFRANPKEK